MFITLYQQVVRFRVWAKRYDIGYTEPRWPRDGCLKKLREARLAVIEVIWISVIQSTMAGVLPVTSSDCAPFRMAGL
jgi:hypothetical protein